MESDKLGTHPIFHFILHSIPFMSTLGGRNDDSLSQRFNHEERLQYLPFLLTDPFHIFQFFD